ncbi:molybdenum ABC transporter ATP-binding protein [Sneathiella chinensis]|uniref:Molybdenum import ATP-binding protein ModC n=1 Tax=Sneathiella chinensis TaxID=349750 RepID=A0ABQ5U6L0_9PROT|nr:molybdenum ABC transporter ATP-binding protein [Sneathiella chinensis]GLQ07538.1 molybdenum import ATP-binding protein ModC [Sneathiella chinensis]
MLEVSVTRPLPALTLEAHFSAGRGITALFGPSGAGKTSLVRMLAGLDTPAHGRIIVNDRPLFERAATGPATCNIPPQKRSIGYVFQENRLFPHYTVRGNLTYGRTSAAAAGKAPVTFDDTVSLLGLEALLDRKPATLSGGEQQRVAIGRALLSNPDLLIMDEPLSSLDLARRHEIMTLIERIRDQFDQTIIYISHSIEEVIRLADTLVLMDQGKVQAFGPATDILSRPALFPFTGGSDAGTVVEGIVTGHDPDHRLSRLDTPAGLLTLPLVPAEPGERLRIRIRARDIAISTRPVEQISILNRLRGIVSAVHPAGSGSVDVTIDTGVPLTARITRKSFDDLGLDVGTEVFALVKSVTADAYHRHSGE